MNISIITLFPELYMPFIQTSLIRRAQEAAIVHFDIQSLFSFCAPKERVDSPTYGHHAGMLLRPEVIEKAVDAQEKIYGGAYKIFFSPHGMKLDQHYVQRLAKKFLEQPHIMLLPARYEGMDARVEEEYADDIISIGDYVLMAGDVPAMVLIEAVLRLLPGVVGKQESLEYESFSGPFVDHPEYTTPVEWKGRIVPEVLRSGNHKAIAEWRMQQAAERTVLGHFDWLRSQQLTHEQKDLVRSYVPMHYSVIMHEDVLLPDSREGTASVTSIDIHDIARSARTYGLQQYFIVTPLHDQQRIVRNLLDFWRTGPGLAYNIHRAQSLELARLEKNLDDVLAIIKEQEGKEALIIGTGARTDLHHKMITYHDQGRIWSYERPVLFVFGTGCGLGPKILDRCDFVLEPLYGLTDFNHLSVRTAAGIIFDRWLGINLRHTNKSE